MKNFNKLSLIMFSLSLYAGHLSGSQNTFDDLFEDMRQEMRQSRERMKSMLASVDKLMGEWFEMPDIAQGTSVQQTPIDINYDNEDKVVITVSFPQGTLKQVDAEANEKRAVTKITVTQEGGDTTIVIDRYGMSIITMQKVEKKTKGENDKESSVTSVHKQSVYQSFQTPVEAAKAQVKMKGDTLIINLPREESVKKLSIDREE